VNVNRARGGAFEDGTGEPMPRTLHHRLIACLLAAVLAACGGSGGGGDGGYGGGTANPPPSPPPIGRADAFRFLNQTTFGATEAEADRVIQLGYARWIDEQLAVPASTQLPHVLAALQSLTPPIIFAQLNADRVDIWFRNALRGPDQLRQRVAWALSQIMVVSQQGALDNYPFALASYYDLLAQQAFGDFRVLLEDVTLHPAMGVYLSMLGNQKPNVALNIRPDENYARELMQLFSIGLVELNPDGSVRRDGEGQPIPTYDQSVIEGFAHVYTGWHWAGAPDFERARPTLQNQSQSMQAYPPQHDTGAKKVLAYPGAVLTTIPAGQSPDRDLDDALDNIFRHPNVAPFISRQLIQRLVTSNPSPQYVERVARVFNDDGAGRRGQLGAVVRAILLDAEARAAPANDTAGKLKEPLLRITQLWRAYGAEAPSGRFRIANPGQAYGQGPLQAPSVFNFYSPFYAPPGEIAQRGLVAPELQIATEYLATQITNSFFVQAFCFTSAPVDGCPTIPPDLLADIPLLRIDEEMSLAGTPPQLVDRIGAKLLGGEMSPALRAEALRLVERAPASLPSLRAAEAIYLVVSSPDYTVQR
jgi:uncharacterized protein (DUF1800 family)